MRQDWYNLLRKKKNLADLISIKLADSCFYICMEMHYQLKEVLRIWSLTETYFWRFCFLIVRSIERLNYLLRPWSGSEAITTASFKKKKKKKKKKIIIRLVLPLKVIDSQSTSNDKVKQFYHSFNIYCSLKLFLHSLPEIIFRI